MKYNIILADPPWSYEDKASAGKRGACYKYSVMELKDICDLKVKNISRENSILILWVTMPKLFESYEVIKAWGFDYKTCLFTWIKCNKRENIGQIKFIDTIDLFYGMGCYTRSNAELCLLASKGKGLKILRHDINSVIYSPIEEHSKKPDIVKKYIVDLFGNLPRVELFARQKTEGWDVIGNEIDGKDIKKYLK